MTKPNGWTGERTKPAFLERDGWKNKDTWSRRHDSFLVEVSRHDGYKGENNWCVYIHVYDVHPTFQHFKADGSISDNAHFDCHSYCSFHKVNSDKAGKIVSHTIGWDYMHDGDWCYSEYATASAASSVFYDASRLFDDAKERYEEARAALSAAEDGV